jgi:primary-amine oxidase
MILLGPTPHDAPCMVQVAGATNNVSEVDVVTEPPSAANPYLNCFKPVETVLKTEKEAVRVADANKARSWKISNPSVVNAISGKPVAYKLLPFTRGPAQPPLLTAPDSAVAKKGYGPTLILAHTLDPPSPSPSSSPSPSPSPSSSPSLLPSPQVLRQLAPLCDPLRTR